MPIYSLIPSDVLFFKDARPFDAGSGYGCRWPEPNIIFHAFHADLHRAFPETEEWEHQHRTGKNGQYTEERNQRFGSLKTFGPFPIKERKWYFNAPFDVQNGAIMKVLNLDGVCSHNLPKPLRCVVATQAEATKEKMVQWWSKEEFEKYLAGDVSFLEQAGKDDRCFYESEWLTGIGIDPERQVQDGEHIYSAEYMRLKEGVSMGVVAEMPVKNGGANYVERMDELIKKDNIIIVAGQQRACSVVEEKSIKLADILPVGCEVEGDRVKWVLLSPAMFPEIKQGDQTKAHPGGWLPNWVDPETGDVLLKKGDTMRGADETREKWRKRVRGMEKINCKLVAAAIPKPIAISGWSERLHLVEKGDSGLSEKKQPHGARPTILAVPAGAVYYFEGKDAKELAAALNWYGNNSNANSYNQIIRRRSTLFGEQGFGIGVCGVWDYSELFKSKTK